MNLLYDLTMLQPGQNGEIRGSGVYGEAVFFALLKKTKNFSGAYNSKRNINLKILESGIKLYDINQISMQEIIKMENIDVFFQCGWNEIGEISVKKHIIVWHDSRWLEILYDDIQLHYGKKSLKEDLKSIIKNMLKPFIKDYLERRRKIRNLKTFSVLFNVGNADYITVSEHSKHGMLNFYPQLAKKDIPVFYAPLSDDLLELPQSKFELKSYFLLTSSARWTKNNLRAVWAFDELFSQRKDLNFKVVLTGVTDEKIYARKLNNKDRFIFMDYVDRAELLSLHKNAYAFIYPSLNEGFGYPPVESMRYGVPVAASGTSSIPEICQNAAIYFDPYNVSEIKNRILQLLDKNIYDEYSARAIERYKIVSERQKQDLEKIANFILGEKEQ